MYDFLCIALCYYINSACAHGGVPYSYDCTFVAITIYIPSDQFEIRFYLPSSNP